MATNTYVALQTQTLGSSSASVTFSSIPATYTDLYIVIEAKNLTGNSDVLMRFNSDSGSNYSATILGGDGSSAYSARRTNSTSVILNYFDFLNSSTATQFNVNIQNYSNATTYKTAILRANRADQATEAVVGLWRNTAAITQIDLTPSSSSFAAGSTFSLYGIKAQVTPGTAKATGGTITYDNFGRVIHTFTSSGTFTPSEALSCDYLVVAGGGGGGSHYAGGGGAGGYRTTTSLSVTSAQTITVGAGGAGGVFGGTRKGANGSDSIFSTITSTGGGGATGRNVITLGSTGGSGAGGAGAAAPYVTGLAGNTPSTSPSQGNNGGNGIDAGGSSAGGGGGGSGSAGGNASSGVVGTAGSGTANSISGTSITYAAGSTGGKVSSGNGAAGTVNRGNGGGGGGDDSPGGAGGSGIVIIRYQG